MTTQVTTAHGSGTAVIRPAASRTRDEAPRRPAAAAGTPAVVTAELLAFPGDRAAR